MVALRTELDTLRSEARVLSSKVAALQDSGAGAGGFGDTVL
jgi:hypothetical protein